MKKLGKDLLRTLQTFRLFGEAPHPSHLLGTAFQAFYVAALQMCGCIGLVEPLDSTPSEGTHFYRFAGQWVSQTN